MESIDGPGAPTSNTHYIYTVTSLLLDACEK